MLSFEIFHSGVVVLRKRFAKMLGKRRLTAHGRRRTSKVNIEVKTRVTLPVVFSCMLLQRAKSCRTASELVRGLPRSRAASATSGSGSFSICFSGSFAGSSASHNPCAFFINRNSRATNHDTKARKVIAYAHQQIPVGSESSCPRPFRL